ncbi:hypothetical protein [Novosphingobium sp.]|uniref:hypothetical protein n=1 Tax=Novosphingobium sp. TaxID=1874826 RepID=UPI000D6E3114|nr:hypothetical protein [Novosphingobium sp.]
MDAIDRPSDCAPVAALLYAPSQCPSSEAIIAAAANGAGFAVTHGADDSGIDASGIDASVIDASGGGAAVPAGKVGWLELLKDGLTFDLKGLSGGNPVPQPDVAAHLGVTAADLQDKAVLTLAPGPHLAGAERLLPVIRVTAALLRDLVRTGAASAVVWLPARLAVRTDLFEKAVSPWLEGGPFPTPALVALHRETSGKLRTEGLKFLINQELIIESDSGGASVALPKVAMRLVDWLVAHGPLSGPTEAVLAGTGAVFLEVEGGGPILARCD